VVLVEVNPLQTEPLKAALTSFLEVLLATICCPLFAASVYNTPFGGNHNSLVGVQCLAYYSF
jgi:hypothetical protein